MVNNLVKEIEDQPIELFLGRRKFRRLDTQYGKGRYLLKASDKGGFFREGFVRLVPRNVLGEFEEHEYAVMEGAVSCIGLLHTNLNKETRDYYKIALRNRR